MLHLQQLTTASKILQQVVIDNNADSAYIASQEIDKTNH
jgi:hypothetical protein